MLMAGKNVTQAGDQLTPVSVERVYQGIIKTHGPVADLVYQLRALKTMQPQAYRKAKTQLPYIVCGTFSPAIRRKEHFAWAEHFMLDIDKISSLGMGMHEVKTRLQADQRVALMFTSPGNDGLKVLFHLGERIHDSGYYSAFYKRFAAGYAAEFGLEGAVDLVTSDVSRCCFMSCDPEAYFNPQALLVDAAAWVNPDMVEELTGIQQEIKRVEEAGRNNTGANEAEKDQLPLPDDILNRIKEKLNVGRVAYAQKQKNYIQPGQLDEAMPGLQKTLEQLGIVLSEQKPINYGRQLRLKAGLHWAEVNLFYGKAGFRAVQTTKTGSHPHLAEMGVVAIQQHFDELMQKPVLLNAEAEE